MNLDSGLIGILYKLFRPVELLITYILSFWHKIFVFLGMPDGPGAAWVLSVVFLVILVRLCILPLFLKQLKSMRRMQAFQPEMKKIQNKYKGKTDQASKEAQSREMMELYRKEHINPMGSCLPLLFQGPIFMSMFYVFGSINKIAEGQRDSLGSFDADAAKDFVDSPLFNVHLSTLFSQADSAGKVTMGIFVALMCASMFLTQFYSLKRNINRDGMDESQYKMQLGMAFVFPIMYIFSGLNMPLDVCVYWLTNNIWTLAQTIIQVHIMPNPGSPAAKAKEKRDLKKDRERREKEGLPTIEEEQLALAKQQRELKKTQKNQRVQPVKKKKKNKK